MPLRVVPRARACASARTSARHALARRRPATEKCRLGRSWRTGRRSGRAQQTDGAVHGRLGAAAGVGRTHAGGVRTERGHGAPVLGRGLGEGKVHRDAEVVSEAGEGCRRVRSATTGALRGRWGGGRHGRRRRDLLRLPPLDEGAVRLVCEHQERGESCPAQDWQTGAQRYGGRGETGTGALSSCAIYAEEQERLTYGNDDRNDYERRHPARISVVQGLV